MFVNQMTNNGGEKCKHVVRTRVSDESSRMTVYLDCNATTPLEPEVAEVLQHYFVEEYGNAGSRTHSFGARAKKAVQHAREQVGGLVGAKTDEVVFTSGATEANNLALLGLAEHGQSVRRTHIVSTMIEHKAVLEPLEFLRSRGFEVTLVPPGSDGVVHAEAIERALRDDTLCVSVMHVNNETGAVQPLTEITAALANHDAFLHVDAAQSFGKLISPLRDRRVDLISASGHKVYGPKGVGTLIARRRRFKRPPLTPLMRGGGQEHGLRPGTLPVPLVVGFGAAAELAQKNAPSRVEANRRFRTSAVEALVGAGGVLNVAEDSSVPHTLSVSFDGLDAEAIMVALKDVVAVSNGSACTSSSYEPSHVLSAMELSETRIRGTLRLSWCHLTPEPDWATVGERIAALR